MAEAKLNDATSSDVDLLDNAGIRTFGDLAELDPDDLYSRLESIINEKKLSATLPEKEKLSIWISQAVGEHAGDIIVKPKP